MNKLPRCSVSLPIPPFFRCPLGASLEFQGPREELAAVRKALCTAGNRLIFRSLRAPLREDPDRRIAVIQIDMDLGQLTQLLLDHFEDIHVLRPLGHGRVSLCDMDGHRWEGMYGDYITRGLRKPKL